MTITARYPGTCTVCKGHINIGDKILWQQGRGASHADLAQCAMAARPAVPAVTLDLTGIVAFLQSAKDRGLKFPKARFLSPENTEMRLSLMSERSRTPGALAVTIHDLFMGSVMPNGEVRGALSGMKNVQELLVAISEDPAAAAAAYGALMCRCSFCNLPLTDAGSVEVGYGPICAASWNLPWQRLGVPELHEIPKEGETS